MANIFRIKRRVTGAPGAPALLQNAELAYNEVDNILYYGQGTGGSGGSATSILSIGGAGAYVGLTGAQTISGAKTWTGANDFTGGSITAPTQASSDSSTKVATTAFVGLYAQPLTAALTAFAAMVAVGMLVQTASGTYAARTLTGSARVIVTNGSGAAANPSFDLATGVVTTGTYPKVTVDTYGRVTAGSALSSGDVTTGLGYTPENPANKGAANGYASLDGGGKVPVSQLPSAVTGGMQYQGTWNASTNSPTLTSATGTQGYYYKVSVAGNTTLDGQNNWTVGDLAIYDGTAWEKVEGGSPDVVSVAGRTGVIVLANTDISGLGTMSTQNASAVNITGGTIGSGVTVALAGNVTGVVAAVNGGTGQSGYAIGDLLQASSTTALSKLAAVATGNVLLSGGVGAVSSWGKVDLTAAITNTLPAVNGGTGNATYVIGDILYASATNALSRLADVAVGSVLVSGGVGAAPSWGTVSLSSGAISGTLGVANGGTGAATFTAGYLKASGTTAFTTTASIPFTDISGTATAAQGGTGNATYAIGDLLQASGTTALSRLTAVATGNVLISGGVGTINSWGKVGLTTHVSGTLPVTNGGTGLASYAVGDLVYASTTTVLSSLADVAVGNVLLSGGVGVAPSYGKVNLTSAVTGTLPVANGGTGTTTSTGTGNTVLSASPTFTGTAAFAAVTATSFAGPLTGNVTGNVSGTAANVTGTVLVANGGTGATTFTAGYLKASGTTAFSTVTTIPNTDISGLGTMSTQNATAVAITGGTIDGITLDGGTY